MAPSRNLAHCHVACKRGGPAEDHSGDSCCRQKASAIGGTSLDKRSGSALGRAVLEPAHRSAAVRQADTGRPGYASILRPYPVTHRTAIGNERLLGIQGDAVRLRVRADGNGGKRTIAHVLPPGFKRVRHYGLLAPAAKTARLALARQLLSMPAANPQAREDAQAFMRRVAAIQIERCPHCKIGHWRLLQQLPPERSALASITPTACRGPP